MKFQKPEGFDYTLILIVAALLALGIFILTSVSSVLSQEKFGNTSYYLFCQIIRGILPGLFLAVLVLFIPLSFLRKNSFYFVLVNLFLMVLIFIPGLGIKVGGASRWLNIGIVSLQPSEFLKLTFILYLSAWLSKRAKNKKNKNWNKKNKNWKVVFLPFLTILSVIVLCLWFQSDLSTLGIITLSSFALYFLANAPIIHVILLGLFGLTIFFLFLFFAPYRMGRLLVFLGKKTDPMGIGYQIKQAIIAIGSGGLLGLGLGSSKLRFGFVPQTISDSIFAIFAEETGFIGSLCLVLLYLLFFWRSYKIAKESKDMFSGLFAMGVSLWICSQAFINIGAMVKLLPLTGVPLPFISYGGSHIVAELVAVGIMLNISRKK